MMWTLKISHHRGKIIFDEMINIIDGPKRGHRGDALRWKKLRKREKETDER